MQDMKTRNGNKTPAVIMVFLFLCFIFVHKHLHSNEKRSGSEWQEQARSVSEARKDSAIFYLLKAAEDFGLENDFAGQASTFNEIGNTYLQMRNDSKAIEYYIAAAEAYREKADNHQMYGRTLINIALIKLNIGGPTQAMDYAQQGLVIAREFGDELAMVFTQRLIGRIYRSQGQYDEAIAEIRQTIDYYRSQEDWSNLGESFQNIANNYYDKREYNLAVIYSDSSMFYNRKAGNRYNLAYSMHSMAFTLMQLDRLNEAKAFSDSAIAAGKVLSNPYLVLDGYRANADIMRMKRDIDGYGSYMALYLAQRDSIDRLQQVAVTRELEAKYQNQVKQTEIEVLLLEQQLLASNVKRQKNMRNGISFTLIVVVVFSVVLVNRFKVLNETRRQLEVEKLRNSIARDLHDDLGSTLSSINIISQMAAQNSQADAGSHFARIGKHSSMMMDKLTDIVWSINPDNDNTEQLIAKMREFASEILEPKSIEWNFYVDKQICSHRPSLEKRKAIFMVFKEAINNAAKYSNASRVDIYLGINKGQFEVKVRDKGKGFDEELVKKGNGLRNMRERARLAGGMVIIKSSSGQGTEVLLQVPIT
ncbi:MAG: hypothetical protein EA361_04700 [Bacteroidetes bacterium]|nr:MAG: hypothetical protein EA361_04700 [Bacteroidota bacterium]